MDVPVNLLKGYARRLATAKPAAKRYTIPDPESPLIASVYPTGKISLFVMPRDPAGRQVRFKIGDADPNGLPAARAKAKAVVERVKRGEPPEPEPTRPLAGEKVDAVFKNFMTRYVGPAGLRSADEIQRIIDVHIEPAWKGRSFVSIRRGDVAKLLDDVEDGSGPVMADRVLAVVRKACNWYAARNEDYVSPVVKGMGRAKPRERARARILSDDEIKVLWAACGQRGTFGAFVKILLLTGQRRAKVAAMRWADVGDDGTWTIPTLPREKGNPGSLTLPKAALEIIRNQPVIDGNDFVFAGRGKKHINAFSQYRDELDAELVIATKKAKAEPPAPWVLHDLRRTARSLMSRAGVPSEHAERVLGHVIPGVEGVYDRHPYAEEKAVALRKLADLVALILKGPAAGNVVPLVAGAS